MTRRSRHRPQARSMRGLRPLHASDVALEAIEWPFGRDLRRAGFSASNPAGRIPAAEIDGARLWEAVADILCETFPEVGPARAQGRLGRVACPIRARSAGTIGPPAATPAT